MNKYGNIEIYNSTVIHLYSKNLKSFIVKINVIIVCNLKNERIKSCYLGYVCIVLTLSLFLIALIREIIFINYIILHIH